MTRSEPVVLTNMCMVCDGSYRYMVFLFKTETFSGTRRSSKEGRVFWVDRKS